jgi:hypothetical protein
LSITRLYAVFGILYFFAGYGNLLDSRYMQKDEVRLEYIHSATKRTFEQNQAFNISFNLHIYSKVAYILIEG